MNIRHPFSLFSLTSELINKFKKPTKKFLQRKKNLNLLYFILFFIFSNTIAAHSLFEKISTALKNEIETELECFIEDTDTAQLNFRQESSIMCTAGNVIAASGATQNGAASNATGAPNNTTTEIGSAGHYLVLTLADELPIGTDYVIYISGRGSAVTADVYEAPLGSTIPTSNASGAPAGFTANGTASGPQDVIVQVTKTASVATKYLYLDRGSGDIEIDAVTYCIVTTCAEATIDASNVTCTSQMPNADAKIEVTSASNADRINYSTGSTYTGNTNYANATPIGALPFTILGGISNPNGTQSYTVRIFNGSSSCFEDVVVGINEVDCTVECTCTDYLYVNDQYVSSANPGLVHKFEINTNTGALTEIPAANGSFPFINNPALYTPHGLAIDNNGNVYIGRHFGGDNEIHKFSCEGELITEDFIPAVNQQRLNYGSSNGILYEPDWGLSSGEQVVKAYDLCDGSLIGEMQINSTDGTNVFGWGFHVDDTYWYLDDYAGRNCIHRGLLDISLYNATGTNTGSEMFCIGDGPNMGITSDDSGNLYVVTKQDRDGALNDFEIRKYSSTGTLLATAADPTNGGAISTPGQAGFWGTRGLSFSNKSNKLYVGNFENCVTVFDQNLNQLSSLNIPNPAGGSAKGVNIATVCCPVSSPLTINKTICAADANGQRFFLNDLFGCEGPICEGLWAETVNTSGGTISFNDCNLSVNVSGTSGCATYNLASDGSGNKQCGVLDMTMQICIEDCSCTVPTVTASTTSVTCNASGIPNSNGALLINTVANGNRVNFSLGSTYTGNTNYANATTIGSLPFAVSSTLPNPASNQNYTLRIFNGASNCFTDVTVTLSPTVCVVPCTNPVLTSLTNQTICIGSTFTAANVTTSVSNGVSVSYQWSNNNGTNNTGTAPISGQTTATLTALPTAAGSYSYTVTATNTADNSCSATRNVVLVINPLPTATAAATPATCMSGSSTANSNGTITLSGFAASDTYQYSIGSSFNSGSATPASATTIPAGGVITNTLANPASAQTYTVRITNSNGCRIDRTVTLNVTSCSCTNPVLTSLTNQTICIGSTFTAANVTTSVSNGVSVSYQWSNNNGTNNTGTAPISGQTTATLTALPTTAGSYSYTVTATNTADNSCSATRNVVLVINPLPTSTAAATPATCPSSSSTANSDGTITLSGFAASDTYQYSTGSSFNSGSATPASATTIPAGGVITNTLANPASAQTYTVRITNSNGCRIDRTVTLNPVTCSFCTLPVLSAFAIQPSCNDGAVLSNGYLQLSAVTNGDRVNFSLGSTYSGDTDYANAVTIGALPFQFNTGLANPSSSEDYTVRVFNGESSCFVDVVVTMNQQDCTIGCDCEEKIYLNDVNTNDIHKFSITNTGSLAEIGSPWVLPGNIASPHGLGVDLNGRLYIGQVTGYNKGVQGEIFQLDCDGNILDSDFINLDNDNFGFQLMSKDGILYTTNNEANEVQAFDLCTGNLVGRMQVAGSSAILAWGMYLNETENSWYVADRWSGNVYTGSLDLSLYTTPAVNSGSLAFDTGIIGGSSSDIAAMGITQDIAGNFYITYNSIQGSGATVSIRKYDNAGNLLMTIDDTAANANPSDGLAGFWGSRGIIYSEEENKLYVSNFDNCLTVFDTLLVEQTALNIGNANSSSAKGISLTKECCPTNNNINIDTTLCTASINDIVFLQELINCEGTICEGLWQEGGSNSGLTYNSCNNSVTINALDACGSFTLASDGTGNNPQCGAFIITVNITVNSLELTVNETSCTDNTDGTFSGNYDVVIDWNSQVCKAGEMINVTHNGTSIGMIDPSTDSSPSTLPLSVSANGNGTSLIQAEFTIAGCSKNTSFKTPSPCPNDVSPCNNTTGCIGGSTFQDNNCNGINETEPGIQGIEVQIYDCNNVLVGTTYTDSDGDWQSCGLTDDTAYRVEFVLPESIACDYSPTKVGTDNNSDIQFSTTNNCLNFGVSPIDACASSVLLLTPCYNFGGHQGTYKDNDAFVGVQTNKVDDPSVDAAGTVIHYATHEQIGTTYGTAVNRQSNTAYAAAYMKRHTGFGPNGTGAIYQIDLTQANPPNLLADLNSIYGAGTAGVNPHDFSEAETCTSGNFSCWFNDVDAWNAVGRTSLGDMDISTDESTLYVMNLEDRNVYQIDLANPTAVQPTFPFPLDQATDPNVTLKPRDAAYDIRPFGLSYHNGLVYAVAMDTEQSRARDNICCSSSDPVVYIYSLNPVTGNWTLVLEQNVKRANDGFFIWQDNFRDSYLDNNTTIPTDIEFDGDDIILGFRDMSADKFGNDAGKPIAGDNSTVFYATITGDIMRFCYDNSSNTYNFESNGSCGGVTSAGANSGRGWPEATTPRGNYYSGDYFSSAHPETALGGLWLNPSDNRLYSTVYDLTAVFQSGIKSLDNTTGLAREAYILIDDSTVNGGFGKAGGLGDLEAACPVFSLEIGNYVWCDSLENGIQDACERGINDIMVQLYDRNGLLVGQDTTLNGQYYFNEKNVDTTGITVNGSGIASPVTAWSGIGYSTQYFIVFGGSQFATDEFTVGSNKYGITSFTNAGSNDNIDSDVDANNLTAGSLGARPDGLPFIDMTTGATGCGDHKYDLGVTCEPSYSLGNQVFQDTDNSGDLNGTETGIDGVQLQLLNADGSVYDSDDTTIGIQALTVTTANGGYYRFDDLPAGDYIVEILASNFTTGNNLENYTSSTGVNQEADPDTDGDINDNGLDTPVSGAIRSGVVTLGATEPTSEAEPGSYGAASTTGTAAVDNLSNLTVDFGFFSCNIDTADLMSIICNNNGSAIDDSDDYLTFTLNPTGSGLGATYNLTVSGGSISPTSASYGSATTFQLQNGSAGAGNITVTIADSNNSSCSLDVGIRDPGSCVPDIDYPDYERSDNPCTDPTCHIISNDIYLGSGVSSDSSNSGSESADGDNDDGVSINSKMQMLPGSTVRLPVTIYNNTGMVAHLRMWVDWNADGDFEDVGEQIEDNTYPSIGAANIVLISVTIPTNAVQTSSIALRARVSTDDTNTNSPCGTGNCASDGEVEDYLLQVNCQTSICPTVVLSTKN